MKKQKNQKKQGKKNLIILLVLLVILIAIIVTVVVVKQKKDLNNENTDQKLQGTQKEEVQEEPAEEYALVDLNNTQNAEVKDGVKRNTSSKLSQERTYKGMTVKNIKLVAEGGITEFTATVENKTGKNCDSETIVVIFRDEEGNEISRLSTILPQIDAGKSNEIDAKTTADVANAYDFEIE